MIENVPGHPLLGWRVLREEAGKVGWHQRWALARLDPQVRRLAWSEKCHFWEMLCSSLATLRNFLFLGDLEKFCMGRSQTSVEDGCGQKMDIVRSWTWVEDRRYVARQTGH